MAWNNKEYNLPPPLPPPLPEWDARLPHSIPSGFPNNLPLQIYTPGWRDSLSKAQEHNTQPGQVSNPDLSVQTPVHKPPGFIKIF